MTFEITPDGTEEYNLIIGLTILGKKYDYVFSLTDAECKRLVAALVKRMAKKDRRN